MPMVAAVWGAAAGGGPDSVGRSGAAGDSNAEAMGWRALGSGMTQCLYAEISNSVVRDM